MNKISIRLQVVIGFGFCLVTAASGADQYCAFAVKVSSPSGRPLAGIPVAMIQGESKEFGHEVRTDGAGSAKLCDAPLEPVTIIVGVDICGAVAVKHVRASWPATKQLYFTYVPEGCNHFGETSSCTILIRVLDEDARPTLEAAWTAEGISSRRLTSSDAFGRILQSVDVGGELRGVLTKRGFAPEKVDVPCETDGERFIEKKIIMHRAQE
jgi:hypothetical protein